MHRSVVISPAFSLLPSRSPCPNQGKKPTTSHKLTPTAASLTPSPSTSANSPLSSDLCLHAALLLQAQCVVTVGPSSATLPPSLLNTQRIHHPSCQPYKTSRTSSDMASKPDKLTVIQPQTYPQSMPSSNDMPHRRQMPSLL